MNTLMKILAADDVNAQANKIVKEQLQVKLMETQLKLDLTNVNLALMEARYQSDLLQAKHNLELLQAQHKSELVDVKSELVDVKSELADVKSELADVKSELADVKSELADVKSELADLNSDILAKLTTDINNLRKKNKELVSESQNRYNAFLEFIECISSRIDKNNKNDAENNITTKVIADTNQAFSTLENNKILVSTYFGRKISNSELVALRLDNEKLVFERKKQKYTCKMCTDHFMYIKCK